MPFITYGVTSNEEFTKHKPTQEELEQKDYFAQMDYEKCFGVDKEASARNWDKIKVSSNSTKKEVKVEEDKIEMID